MKHYYQLIKPGIIRGNLLTAAAGFVLASGAGISWLMLLGAMAGLGLVIASGCVFNNIIDQDIDQKMQRTKGRALVTGTISTKQAYIYGSILGLIGLLILAVAANLLTASIAVMGFIFYVSAYTFTKRHTAYATHIGSISGAIPPVVGYVAVTNKLTITALLLFVVLVAWQMPHFFAIAMYRLSEYRAAHIPVWPAVRGMRQTRIQIRSYIIIFIISCALLGVQAFGNPLFLAVMIPVGLLWLFVSFNNHKKITDVIWAKKMFGISLLVLLVFCGTIFIDAYLSLAVYSN